MDTTTFTADEREAFIRKRVHREAEFWRHLVVFCAVNALVWGAAYVWFLYTGRTKQFFFPIAMTFGWGIGVTVHALATFVRLSVFTAEWEERKVRELLERRP